MRLFFFVFPSLTTARNSGTRLLPLAGESQEAVQRYSKHLQDCEINRVSVSRVSTCFIMFLLLFRVSSFILAKWTLPRISCQRFQENGIQLDPSAHQALGSIPANDAARVPRFPDGSTVQAKSWLFVVCSCGFPEFGEVEILEFVAENAGHLKSPCGSQTNWACRRSLLADFRRWDSGLPIFAEVRRAQSNNFCLHV